MDLVGPLPVTPAGNKFLMTITDYYTKWAVAAALKDKTALYFAHTAALLLSSVTKEENLSIKVTEALFKRTNTQHRITSAYHPQKLQPGIKVLVENTQQKERKGGKLENKYSGPYIIKTSDGKGVFTLKDLDGKVLKKKCNIKRLKAYMDPSSLVEQKALSGQTPPDKSNGSTPPEKSNGPTPPEDPNGPLPTGEIRWSHPTRRSKWPHPSEEIQWLYPTREIQWPHPPEDSNGPTPPEKSNGPTPPEDPNGPLPTGEIRWSHPTRIHGHGPVVTHLQPIDVPLDRPPPPKRRKSNQSVPKSQKTRYAGSLWIPDLDLRYRDRAVVKRGKLCDKHINYVCCP
ncbi:uncharacterized protein LOC135344196 isoform X2 [Halichondria panicea]|uniref:uncharacterized protein LOC135344196 isoform X2 n=1 Tax=Halichondria panicea TaxID=6063 RepID=UPI00312BBC26